jgi:phage terminase large subunit
MPLDALTDSEGPGPLRIRFPPRFRKLLSASTTDAGEAVRYRVAWGGRGGAKSRSFARAAIGRAMVQKHLILCTREFQTSIADSVHRVIAGQIRALGLAAFFEITDRTIRCKLTGSEFIFRGLKRNIAEIRSLEGVTICWIEEGQTTSRESMLLLDPTIRGERGGINPEIWISFNAVDPDDYMYATFVTGHSTDALVEKVGWQDNPWFPESLNRLRKQMMLTDADAYDWVWEGMCRHISSAAIFKDRYAIEGFEEPEIVDKYFYGVDFGFANDPLCGIRSYIHNNDLWITHEFFGVGVELEDIPYALKGGRAPISGMQYEGIPGITDWPVKADNARPETISYVLRQGINMSAALKWQGCVEDRISHLKGFGKIHIHERCVGMAQEARLYSYKTDEKRIDPVTKQPLILPIVVDAHNHGWDAVGYSLDGYITKRGGLGVWEKLAG